MRICERPLQAIEHQNDLFVLALVRVQLFVFIFRRFIAAWDSGYKSPLEPRGKRGRGDAMERAG